MMKFTATFLIFAYLVGGFYAIATGDIALPSNEFKDSTQEEGWSTWISKVPGLGTVVDFLGRFKNAVAFILDAMLFSFKPLSWDFGVSVFNAMFKGIWSILLAVAYVDLSKDVVQVFSRIINAVGNWIPFT